MTASGARSNWTIKSGEYPKVVPLDDLRERRDSRQMGAHSIDRRIPSVHPDRLKASASSALDIEFPAIADESAVRRVDTQGGAGVMKDSR